MRIADSGCPECRSYAPVDVTQGLPMELEFPAFAFIMTLATVINGTGIVRLLTSFAVQLCRPTASALGVHCSYSTSTRTSQKVGTRSIHRVPCSCCAERLNKVASSSKRPAKVTAKSAFSPVQWSGDLTQIANSVLGICTYYPLDDTSPLCLAMYYYESDPATKNQFNVESGRGV